MFRRDINKWVSKIDIERWLTHAWQTAQQSNSLLCGKPAAKHELSSKTVPSAASRSFQRNKTNWRIGMRYVERAKITSDYKYLNKISQETSAKSGTWTKIQPIRVLAVNHWPLRLLARTGRGYGDDYRLIWYLKLLECMERKQFTVS